MKEDRLPKSLSCVAVICSDVQYLQKYVHMVRCINTMSCLVFSSLVSKHAFPEVRCFIHLVITLSVSQSVGQSVGRSVIRLTIQSSVEKKNSAFTSTSLPSSTLSPLVLPTPRITSHHITSKVCLRPLLPVIL